MMSTDKEWAGLVDLWQRSDPPPSFEKLAKRVRAETRKQVLAYVVEAVVSLWLFITYIRQVKSGLLPAELAAALFSMLFAVFWMVMLTRNMKGTWLASAESTDAFLKVSTSRREAQVRWYRFVRKCLIGFASFVLVWGPWMLVEHWARYKAEPWRAIVGFGGIFSILLLIEISLRYSLRRLFRELQLLRSTQLALKQADEDTVASESANLTL